MSSLPTRDPQTGQFLSKYASGDSDYDETYQLVADRLTAEHPSCKSDAVLQLLIHEAAGAAARIAQFDAAIARLGGPVNRQGRVRTAYVAREREAARLQRLLRDLRKTSRR